MNKEKQHNTLVPELRFSKFENDGGWKKKPFSKLFQIGSGRDYKHLKKGTIPVYGTGGYMLSVNNFLYDGKSACIGRKGTINKPMLLSGKFWTVDTLFYTHSFEGCSPEFVYLLFQNINWLKYNEAGGVPSLSKVIINKIEVYIPKPKEQQILVDFISYLENVITAEKEKLASLKDHKEGLLQQLFPAKGERKPQFRFPEFVGNGDWEEVELGNYCFITTGRLDANAMVENGKYRFYTCAKNFYRIDDFAFDTEALLVSGNGANVGYIHYYKGKFNAYQRTYVLDQFSMDIHYLKYNLEYNLSRRISSEKKEGNTPYIVKSTLSEMKIILPKNKVEQQRIANCLSSLDNLIQSQTEKVTALKEHKKGLMQQLFPNIK